MLSVAAVLLLLRGAAAAPAPAARHQRMSSKRAAARGATDAYLAERRAAIAAAAAGGSTIGIDEAAAAAACPCDDAALCAPIGGAPVAEREFYGFGGDGFETFEWDYVTTVAWGARCERTHTDPPPAAPAKKNAATQPRERRRWPPRPYHARCARWGG